MKKFLLMTKRDYLLVPHGMELIDYLETPATLPPWISEEELQVYADKFQESGFTGALNYFRIMELWVQYIYIYIYSNLQVSFLKLKECENYHFNNVWRKITLTKQKADANIIWCSSKVRLLYLVLNTRSRSLSVSLFVYTVLPDQWCMW